MSHPASSIDVRFWGVRGSIASPGPETAKIGGNTSCVEVRCGTTRIILDAGTGLRGLGDAWLASRMPIDATLLLSHAHWDHIQGLPFFVPAYLPTTKLHVVGGANGVMGLRQTLAHQMTQPVFPVRLDELGAEITVQEARAGESFGVGAATVRVAKGNHPGGVLAFRIEHAGRSIVYATDTEHFACVDPQLLALAAGADVLIYDAQYTPEEYRGDAAKGQRSKVGWGHSTYVAAAELAREAGVRELLLFHHDPSHKDDKVLEIEARTQELFERTRAAREGMTVTLEGDRGRDAGEPGADRSEPSKASAAHAA